MLTGNHRWTETDDVIAFYLSRHGARRLPLMEAGIAKRLGMSEGSLARRQANFAYLDGRSGLRNVAKQSRRVHQQYEKATEPELRTLVLQVVGKPERKSRT